MRHIASGSVPSSPSHGPDDAHPRPESTCDGQTRGTRQIGRQRPPAPPPHTPSRPPLDLSDTCSHRHAETSAKSRPSAPAHRAIVLAASCDAWSMHMQRLALSAAAPADRQACACGMLHASEVPMRHHGEVSSQTSRRPPAACTRQSKTTASTIGMDSRLPAASDTISSNIRFRIDLRRYSVSDVLSEATRYEECYDRRARHRRFKGLGRLTGQNGGAHERVLVPRQPGCIRTTGLPLATSAPSRAARSR